MNYHRKMIKIYHNPRCSKSRETLKLLHKKGIEPEIILYLEKGLTTKEVEEILSKLNLVLNITAREIMRKNEEEFKEQNLGDKNLSEENLIAAIVKTPKLLERPIVINKDKAALGRPPENVLEIL